MSVTLSHTPVLTTERLTLRAPVAADWPAFRDFALSDRAAFVRSDEATVRNAWRGFGHVIGHWVLRGFGLFVLTRTGDDTPLGTAGPWFPADWPEPELGWTLWSGASEGRGYATEATRAARSYTYETLGWRTAVSYIDPANTASIAVAERLGASRDDAADRPGDDLLVYRHPAAGAPR